MTTTEDAWVSGDLRLPYRLRTHQAEALGALEKTGGGRPLSTGSPEGEGVPVTHRGSDPFDATTALRVHWR